MGRAIAAIIDAAADLSLAGVWSRASASDGFPVDTRFSHDIDSLLAGADVLIDFSLPEGTVLAARSASRAGTPLVCGVSGLSEDQLGELRAAAADVPVVYDRNMSQGIAVLTAVVKQVSQSLGSDFTVTVDETHHRHKIDAPSGTALKLGEAVAASRGKPLADLMWYEQEGDAPDSAIRFRVERRGEVPGDHSVSFESAAESLTLAHSVATRDVFAAGAVRAARWVMAQKPGIYGMTDVLGLAEQEIADGKR